MNNAHQPKSKATSGRLLRRFRHLLSIGCAAGAIAMGGAWGYAYYLHTVRPQGFRALSAGYAYGQDWLVNVVLYGDGQILAQLFSYNPTAGRGLYGRLVGRAPGHAPPEHLLLPEYRSKAPGDAAAALVGHAALPIGCLAVIAMTVQLTMRPSPRTSRSQGSAPPASDSASVHRDAATTPALPENAHEAAP